MIAPILIFLHLPKTGGSSLGHALHRQYSRSAKYLVDGVQPGRSVDALLALSEQERRRFHCISGHIPFGLHRHLPDPAVYTTLIRDPVERLISHYHHVLNETAHYLHEQVAGTGMSLHDYVAGDLSLELRDDQVRSLSGIGFARWDARDLEVDAAVYAAAIENIEAHFPVVGVTERFEPSLLLMQTAFRWGNVFYTRRKVGRGRPEREAVAPETIEAIRRRNRYDMQLHAYVQARLARQIGAAGASFHLRAAWFTRANRLYNSLRSGREVPGAAVLWAAGKRLAGVRDDRSVGE